MIPSKVIPFRLAALLLVPIGVGLAAPAEKAADEVAVLVRGNNAFAFDLYGQLRAEPGNLFLSPYSISTALAMTSAGARGATLTEMETALHFPAQERLHPACAALIRQVNGEGQKKGYQLSTANALWGQKGYGFLPDFLKLTKDHYGAGLTEVDFARSPEVARKTINEWVEKQTREKIKDLLKPGIVTTRTRLVLTNAIYFKGDWQSQFKKDQTREQPFFLANGSSVKAPLMFQKGTFKQYRDDKVTALELPYAGKDLAMLVLLPAKADGLAALEKELRADRLGKIVGNLREHGADVFLPRFKTTSEFLLNDKLKALGMKRAFANADFSGINGRSDLSITAVVHKAFVEVNEEGTEATGATAVVMGKSKPPTFRADRPFVFLIRDTRNGSVLFLGRINDPTK